MNPQEQAIHADRQSTYGDWEANMRGTSEQISGLLRNYESMNPGEPLPGWWAPLVMVAVKLNRIASGVYHADSFTDLRVYLSFIEWMQGGRPARPGHERIYIAGPYSAPTREGVEANTRRAVEAAAEIMRRGHDAHCPHCATDPIDRLAPDLGYERWMRLDFSIIQQWATAVLYLAPSPGADRELAEAKRLGLKVYRSVEEVPHVPAGH